jgi:hypothetical protein
MLGGIVKFHWHEPKAADYSEWQRQKFPALNRVTSIRMRTAPRRRISLFTAQDSELLEESQLSAILSDT